MKRIILSLAVVTLFSGCINLPKAIKEASKDNAEWDVEVVTMAATVRLHRKMPVPFQYTNLVARPNANSVLITPTPGLSVERSQ